MPFTVGCLETSIRLIRLKFLEESDISIQLTRERHAKLDSKSSLSATLPIFALFLATTVTTQKTALFATIDSR